MNKKVFMFNKEIIEGKMKKNIDGINNRKGEKKEDK